MIVGPPPPPPPAVKVVTQNGYGPQGFTALPPQPYQPPEQLLMYPSQPNFQHQNYPPPSAPRSQQAAKEANMEGCQAPTPRQPLWSSHVKDLGHPKLANPNKSQANLTHTAMRLADSHQNRAGPSHTAPQVQNGSGPTPVPTPRRQGAREKIAKLSTLEKEAGNIVPLSAAHSKHIMISCTHSQQSMAHRIAGHLKSCGEDVWVDFEQVPAYLGFACIVFVAEDSMWEMPLVPLGPAPSFFKALLTKRLTYRSKKAALIRWQKQLSEPRAF